MWGLYGLLILLIILYAFFSSVIIGIGALLLFAAIIVLEFRFSVHSEGLKKSVIDLVVVVVAVAAVFGILTVILQTSSPIDVVTSCSMLPSITRGEALLLHGIPNMSSFLATNHVPVVNLTQSQFNKMIGNFSSEYLAFWAYQPNNKSKISEIVQGGNNFPVALYNQLCLDQYSEENQVYNYYRCYVAQQPQSNLIKYNYSVGNILINNTRFNIVYTSSITIANTTITENYSNPVIVYATNRSDIGFSGHIIHRIFAAIDVSGKYWLLTKGDNNPGLDIEFANYPPSQNSVLGYYLGGLPYFGYIRLFIVGQFQAQVQCSQIIQH